MSKKKVLLLGGTGAMGVYIAPELESMGYDVDITSRQDRESDSPKIKYINGDAKDEVFLKKILLNTSYDAIIDFMVYSTDDFSKKIDLLLNATNQYIFVSTYRVFANSEVITENSPRLLDVSKDTEFLSTNDYSLEKARQEDILTASKKKNWTIIRPSITYSKSRFQLGTLEADTVLSRTLEGKAVVLPIGMLSRQTTMTWAGDVARMVSRLVANKKAFANDYNVVTNEHVSWNDVAKIYKDTIGLKLKTTDLENYIEIMGGGLVRYQVEYDRMYDRVCDNAKVLTVTNLRQEDFTTVSEGLANELKWFIDHPTTLEVNESIQIGMDVALKPVWKKALERLGVKNELIGVVRKIKHKTRLRTRYHNLKKVFKQNRVSLVESREYSGAIVTLPGNYNYGNLVQKYALQVYLKRHGYKFRIIDMIRINEDYDPSIYGNMQEFFNETLDTIPFEQTKGVIYKNYVVGSDQIWRNWYDWVQHLLFNNFLDFVEKKTNKISYAASFGVDTLEEAGYSEDEIVVVKPLLRDFNAISVREESGIPLVRELTGNDNQNVKLVLDPTLLLKADDYSTLIDKSKVAETNIAKCLGYVLDDSGSKADLIRTIAQDYNNDYMVIAPHEGIKYDPVELWLKGFRDAEFIITDSFHGTVFSIINNKPFIVIANKKRGLSRMENLLEITGISKDRLVFEEDIAKFDKANLTDIDWKDVNGRLERLRKDSGDWLINNLVSKRGL